MKRSRDQSILRWVGNNTSEKKQLISTSSTIEMISCPFCSRKYSQKDIEGHVVYHVMLADSKILPEKTGKGGTTDTTGTDTITFKSEVADATLETDPKVENGKALDAFAEMMKSSKTSVPRRAIFRLDISETGRIIPSFSYASEKMVQVTDEVNDTWASSIRIKNFGFGSDKCELVLELKSNISSSTSRPRPAGTREDAPIPLAVVKSMLQKAVRRRRHTSAARLAHELYRLSPTELLRRLPVIIVEDSAMHPGYPAIVWMMLAVSKGYHLPDLLLVLILHLTIEVSLVQSRDFVDVSEDDVSAAEMGATDVEEMPKGAARDLVASLLLRVSFGGMPGDMVMLGRGQI